MPVDPLYLPVQAGRALHAPLPYTGDDTGENISGKNKNYCELTCLYWAWRNLDAKKRNYYIETGYSQYAHAHHEEDLTATRAILSERCPDYVEAFDRTLARTKGHRFNMFIMRHDLLDRYCRWLFDILFELEVRLDISGYSDYDKRVFGFVAERLLDVWLETNHIQYLELPVLHLESQHWLKKGTAFLKRKFRGRN